MDGEIPLKSHESFTVPTAVNLLQDPGKDSSRLLGKKRDKLLSLLRASSESKTKTLVTGNVVAGTYHDFKIGLHVYVMTLEDYVVHCEKY